MPFSSDQGCGRVGISVWVKLSEDEASLHASSWVGLRQGGGEAGLSEGEASLHTMQQLGGEAE